MMQIKLLFTQEANPPSHHSKYSYRIMAYQLFYDIVVHIFRSRSHSRMSICKIITNIHKKDKSSQSPRRLPSGRVKKKTKEIYFECVRENVERRHENNLSCDR